MFKNIGKKIKRLAAFIAWAGTILSVLGFIMLFMITGELGIILIAFVGMLVGILIAQISTWLLYGFGELIDKTSIIAENTVNLKNVKKSKDTTDELMRLVNLRKEDLISEDEFLEKKKELLGV